MAALRPCRGGGGYRATFAFPMRLRDQTIGALNLFRAEPGAVGADEVRGAQSLAHMAAIGIIQERAVRESRQVASPFGRLKGICRVAVELLPVTGAGVMLMAQRAHQGTLYATDERIQSLEDLQNAAAEGPCIDSYVLGRPVLETDLAENGTHTWPILARAALDAGMRALFSFPLQLDDSAVGALNLYRDHPGDLDRYQIDDARLLAAIAARQVLAMQAEAAPGSLPAQIADLSGDRAAIEQATGMVSGQLDVPIHEAEQRLRTLARQQERSLVDVAHDILTHTQRLP